MCFEKNGAYIILYRKTIKSNQSLTDLSNVLQQRLFLWMRSNLKPSSGLILNQCENGQNSFKVFANISKFSCGRIISGRPRGHLVKFLSS
jgi:hypothetical protein